MEKYSNSIAYLRALGLADELDSFVGRKRIQKIIYLLKQFGADLRFGYGWYIHGPYSPELTRTLFNPPEDALEPERELGKSELEITNRMRNFLAEDFYSVNDLELIVSLIYLIKHGPEKGFDTKSKIISYLNKQKPQFSIEEIDIAWDKIDKSKIWDESFRKIECN